MSKKKKENTGDLIGIILVIIFLAMLLLAVIVGLSEGPNEFESMV